MGSGRKSGIRNSGTDVGDGTSWQAAQPSAALDTDTSEGVVSIRVSEVIASTDPEVQLLKSWVQIRHSQTNADQVTVDASKIAALSLLLDISTAEVRQLLMRFRH